MPAPASWYSCARASKADREGKKLLNRFIICITLHIKKYSCSFTKLWLNHWCHMDYFNDVFTTFLDLERGSCIAIYTGSENCRFHQIISWFVSQWWKTKVLRVWNDMRESIYDNLNFGVNYPFKIEANGAFPLHGTARYGSLLGGFPLGTVPGTWYFFSTTSAEVPSEPYRYQNVMCKLCWSLIGRRKSSLLRHWTCDTRPSSTALPARFKSAQPAKDRTQLLFKQTHIFASTAK